MKEILYDIVISIIGKDPEIKIEEYESDDGSVNLELSVSKNNMGKIIGKNGMVARAVRSVVKAYANKNNKRVMIEIV